jgi:hypothetical protein
VIPLNREKQLKLKITYQKRKMHFPENVPMLPGHSFHDPFVI